MSGFLIFTRHMGRVCIEKRPEYVPSSDAGINAAVLKVIRLDDEDYAKDLKELAAKYPAPPIPEET